MTRAFFPGTASRGVTHYLDWASRAPQPLPVNFVHAEWITLHDNPGFRGFVDFLRAELDRIGPAQEDLCLDFFQRAAALPRPDRKTGDLLGFRAVGLHPSTDPLRLVALDTLVDGKHHGSLGPDQLAWLDATLAEQPERPTVIMMHHPPFATRITYMDNYSLDDAAAFAEVVRHHPQIERILCGHLHRAIDRRFAGTVAGTAPSTAHQIRINLVPGARISFNFEPPGYQLHIWQDGSLVTHTALFGEWLEPLA